VEVPRFTARCMFLRWCVLRCVHSSMHCTVVSSYDMENLHHLLFQVCSVSAVGADLGVYLSWRTCIVQVASRLRAGQAGAEGRNMMGRKRRCEVTMLIRSTRVVIPEGCCITPSLKMYSKQRLQQLFCAAFVLCWPALLQYQLGYDSPGRELTMLML
jgi:hypothetical protein